MAKENISIAWLFCAPPAESTGSSQDIFDAKQLVLVLDAGTQLRAFHSYIPVEKVLTLALSTCYSWFRYFQILSDGTIMKSI